MCLLEDIPLWLRIIYRLFGIVQFTCKSPQNYFLQILPRLWSLPLFFFYCYCCVELIKIFVVIKEHDLLKTELIVTFLALLAILTCMVVFMFRSNKLKILLKKLDEIKLERVHEQKERCLKLLVLTLLLLLSCFVPYLFSWPVFYIMYYKVPPGICFLNHLFLSNVLDIICSQFTVINKELERELRRISTNKIFFLYKNKRSKELKENDKFSSISCIEKLSFLHYNLVHLTVEITKLFDISTILSMVLWFGYVICCLYFFIKPFLEGTTRSTLYYSYLICDFIFYCLWLLIMIRTCTHTQTEASKTTSYIHQAWNYFCEKENIDGKVRHLHLISLRLLNTKLRFTARNFFSLDESFMRMMVAAVTTYFVITIEFRMNDNILNGRPVV
ncbi:hypothetical protein Zmor_014566 [Zophobas morio]|uniref:Gustatory receptor n=1 Tax=Zophobas morio TaxID=2755281 RepID=A0AA38MGY7_9CUCU|nr:hypothetical protein Zmor_014566 [Zophobas morio]